MTQNDATGMKAIWGIVLMVNLAMVPFYNAAIAKGNNEPVPYTPDTTPEWSFGMEEGTVAVMGAEVMVGSEAGVSLQPEINDPAIQDLLDFHVLAFETVFGRDYDGTESAYFFEQPLDELTYATVVPGWNTVGEPVDALVLLAQPIDVSDIEPENGVTFISAAFIAGTLEGVGKQGFWGLSLVYDFSDGVRYNDLLLLSELDATTEEALMRMAGFLGHDEPGGDLETCYELCAIEFHTCMRNASINLDTCKHNTEVLLKACGAVCIGGALIPGVGLLIGAGCLSACLIGYVAQHAICTNDYDGAAAICVSNYVGCVAACRVVHE